MKRKIISVTVDDFECIYCGHKEYAVLDPYSKDRKIICDRCGKTSCCDYRIVKTDLPKYTTTGVNEEERLDADETFVVIGILVCVLVFLFILFVLFCLF